MTTRSTIMRSQLGAQLGHNECAPKTAHSKGSALKDGALKDGALKDGVSQRGALEDGALIDVRVILLQACHRLFSIYVCHHCAGAVLI